MKYTGEAREKQQAGEMQERDRRETETCSKDRRREGKRASGKKIAIREAEK